MQSLWCLSHDLINVWIPFEIIFDCNALALDSRALASMAKADGRWSTTLQKRKVISLHFLGLRTMLFVAAQVLMLSSSDCKIDTLRAGADSDIVMSSTYFQYEQRGRPISNQNLQFWRMRCKHGIFPIWHLCAPDMQIQCTMNWKQSWTKATQFTLALRFFLLHPYFNSQIYFFSW